MSALMWAGRAARLASQSVVGGTPAEQDVGDWGTSSNFFSELDCTTP